MKFENQHKLFKLQNSMLKLSERLAVLHHVLPVVHLFCFTALLLFNMSDELYGSADGLIQVLDKLQSDYFSIHQATLYALVGNLMGFVSVVATVIRLKLMRNYDQISHYKKVEKILLITSVCIFYIFQVSIYFVGWSFAAILLSQGLTFALLKCSLPLLYFTYTNLTSEHSSLYGWQTVPIILAIAISTNVAFYMFIILSLVYLLFVKRLLTEKICISVSLFMIVFVVMNSSDLLDYNASGSEQSPISFLCLAFVLVLAAIIVTKMRQNFLLKNREKLMNKIFKTICEVKSQVPFTSLDFHQYYELYNSVNQLILAKRQNQTGKLQIILEKDHKKLTKHDFFQLLEAYLDKESKSSTDNNTQKLILLIKVRMQLDYPFSKIAQDIFSISEKFQRGGSKNINEFMELFEEVIKKYGILKNQQLQTSYALYVNQLHQQFQVQTLEVLEKINDFWNQNAKKELEMVEVQRCFGKIFKEKEEIDELYKKLSSHQVFKKEKIIMEILDSILNPYKIPKQTIAHSQSKQQNTFQSMSFVITQNDQIKFASKDFLKSMGKSNQLIYENVDKKQIFGNELAQYVDSLIHKMTPETQNQWTTVPVICKGNLIKLKKIRILWFPSLDVQRKLMIKFSEHQTLAKRSFLIYHYQTDTIKYYNQCFLQAFSINQEKFTHRLNYQKIFFNQLFVSQNSQLENIKSDLKVGSKVKCKIYLNKYVEKGATQMYNVEIEVVNSLRIGQEAEYCVLKIESFREDKKYSASSNANTETRNIIVQKDDHIQALNQKSLMKKYQSQQFFCKLPNLYEGTITEKQSQLQDESRVTYLKIMALVFCLLAVMLLAFWSLENIFLQERISNYRKGITAIQNTSEQYALMYQMYSIAIKRYYLKKYPSQSEVVMNVSSSVVDQVYTQGEQQFLDQFLQRYLIQMKQPPNSVIDYNIDFETFSIKTNTQKTTLIDFAENFKNNVLQGDIDFLLKNYDNFRELTIHYEKAFSFKEKLNNVVSVYQTYLWVTITLAVLFLFIINIILCKTESTVDLVFNLAQKLEIKQIKQHLKTFLQQKKRIMSIFSQSQFSISSHEEVRTDSPSTYRCITQSEVETLKITEEENQNEHMTTQNPNNSALMIKNQSGFIDDNDQVKEKELARRQKQLISQEKHIVNEPFLKKMSRKLPFIILKLALLAIFFYDRSLLAYERQGITQIYQLKSQFYVSLLHIKRQQVDASIIPAWRDFYKNNSIPDRYLRQNVTLVASLPTKLHLNQLNAFEGEAFDILTSNLCNYIGAFGKVAIKPCQTYLGGIVTKGFKSTVDNYIDNGKKVANQSLSEFGTYPCTQERCPLYFEHLFVSILMGQTLRTLLARLGESMEVAFEQMTGDCQFRIMLKLMSVVLVCVFYGFYWRYLKSRCKKALQFFTMIPKSIMCGLKMTIYLRKSRFFEKIDMI